ncbi:hypothetical protein, partial [Diaphorobacter nitroreducens]|uniref:hypothetical protein n=1 Tax=Diaphorobacter nitroreducens TaxID=164759 RepID=UPI0035AFD223
PRGARLRRHAGAARRRADGCPHASRRASGRGCLWCWAGRWAARWRRTWRPSYRPRAARPR